MSNGTIMWLWGAGILVTFLLLPFLPRSDVRTPMRALGTVLVIGLLLLPFLLPLWLFSTGSLLYLARWIEYREFLVETEVESLESHIHEYETFLLDSRRSEMEIQRGLHRVELLKADVRRLNEKAGRLYSRRRRLVDKLYGD